MFYNFMFMIDKSMVNNPKNKYPKSLIKFKIGSLIKNDQFSFVCTLHC